MQDLKYRNEFKHIINKAQAVILKSRLKAVLQSDAYANGNGEYFIRSLYFDTHDDKALGEKYIGAPFREKYRIRFYNHNPSKIKLENKIKRFNANLKVSSELTKDEVLKILNGDYEFLKEKDSLAFKFYRELTSEGMVAKTITDYTRTPFICPLGNVRITIDSDLRSPVGGLMDMFNPHSPTVSIFPDGRCVLEVKYDEYIPDYIHKIVQQVDGSRTGAMSKYAACRRFL